MYALADRYLFIHTFKLDVKLNSAICLHLHVKLPCRIPPEPHQRCPEALAHTEEKIVSPIQVFHRRLSLKNIFK